MDRMLPIVASGAALLLMLGAPDPAGADVDTAGEFTLATDYVFRGVSQTMSGAALQGELGIEHGDGWYGFVWASNVDFNDGTAGDDGARLELNLGGGFSRQISTTSTGSVGATVYLFPNTVPGISYDYVEWYGSLDLDDHLEITVGYSDSVFGSGSDGVFYSIGTHFEISDRVGVGLELGHYDLERAFGASYSYAELAIAGMLQPVSWRISYFTTTDRAAELFHEATIGERVVAALSLSF